MADPIGPIEDSYIDGIIKASNAYNPKLNLTQGVQLRLLVKALRDRLEQEISNLSEPSVHMINILYADLVTAIAGGSLLPGYFYRITDYQTVHNIPATTPAVVNTGPVEPLIVLAIDVNELSPQAWSDTYPQDNIIYSVKNTYITGATKGCILERHDTIQNARVCNDFRNVKCRRWKLAPVAFNTANAYPQYATTQAPDGGIYYVSKPGGFAAGAASTPSLTSDDWVQVFPDNNYYYSRVGTGSIIITITSNGSPTYSAPAILVDGASFIDTPIFPNYGTGFYNIDISNTPGGMINLVFFNDNQTMIARNVRIAPAEFGFTTTNPINSTFVLKGAGCIEGIEFEKGIEFSQITATGKIRNWKAPFIVYAATLNVATLVECNFTPYYGLLRGTLVELIGWRMEFMVTPMNMQNISFPSGMGNLKFNTTAYARGWNVINGLGSSEISTGAIQSSAPDVVVDVAMSWRTFIGYPDFTSAASHEPSTDLQTQINLAKTRHIVYAYEEPSFKSIIKITNGFPHTVNWQTDLADVNLTTPSGADNSEKRLMTYFTRHGNDFQIQQKDNISGSWAVNTSPSYSIDAVDANGNVTSVTFTPRTGSGETHIIIV